MLYLALLIVLLPSVVFGQTTNARIYDGSGNSIPSATGTPSTSDRGLTVKDPFVAARFPAAFASDDAVAAQTATFMHGGMMGWNGTGWDRLQLDASKYLKVAIQNASLSVTGTFWQATQPVSATSLPLPTGASTEAKQPALGTAGTASADVLTVQGIASMTPLKTDGSGVTQPISGTVTVTDGAGALNVIVDSGTVAATQSGTWNVTNVSGTVSLPTGASTLSEQQTQTTALQLIDNLPLAQGSTTSGQSGALALGAVTTAAPTYTTAQTNPLSLTTAGALRTDSSATTQPVSGTVSITANSSVNVAQINGVTTTMGNGVSGTGVQRVTIASDSTGQVALAAGSATIGALTANQSVNVAQVNGVTTSTGVGAAGTGTQRIVDVASGSTGSAPPTQAGYVGGIVSGATGGLLGGITVCDSWVAINQTAGAQLVTGVSGRKVYICSINLVTATAQNIAIVSGTGTVCATSPTAISGGTTAATGWNLAANSGLAYGSGLGVVMRSAVNADNVCLLQSGSGQISGAVAYAIY